MLQCNVRFSVGRLYATNGAIDALNEAGAFAADYIQRHATGDWGEVCADDAQANEYAVGNDLRILSAYTLVTGTRLWLITEADRSATTLLLPDEY